MKKVLSFSLIFVLMLSLCAVSYAVPVRANDESAEAQMKLLAANFDSYKQTDAADTWSYTITDMDHNGRLELIAASTQGLGKTYVKAWEVSEDGASVAELKVSIPTDETFPDILTENADTFYNPTDDTWSYTFYDNIVLSADEAYYAKCFVGLKDGALGFQQLAVQHTVVTSNVSNTTYMDNNGAIISGEQYNNAGSVSSVDMAKSSTNFDWIPAGEVSEARFADCYAVFKGTKQPPEKAAQTAPPTPAPIPAPTNFMTITKNPTSESRVTGETAWFVSGASGYTSLAWTFVSPQGGEYSVQNFQSTFPYCSVGGAESTTLTVNNLSTDMSGWGVYCTFYNNGQTARTNTAYMYVAVRQQQSQPKQQTQQSVVSTAPVYYSYGTFGGYYKDENGNLEYDVYYPDGAYTTYYWDGSSLTNNLDGSYIYTSNDGSFDIFDDDGSYMQSFPDGSYMEYRTDGSWEFYDAASNTVSGGIDYDDDDLLMEIYSDVFGWGYLDDWD